MATTTFRTALAHVLAHEGGAVDHPQDPGGRTNMGVTQRVYDAWRRNAGLPQRDVFRATRQEAAKIYKEQYWDRIGADHLPAGVDYLVFDGAVNSGPVQSVKWLQRALGVKADGVIGQVTTAALRANADAPGLINAVCERRMVFLKQLRTWRVFGAGWTRRVAEVKATALAMASGGRAVRPDAPAATGKAELTDARVIAGKGIASAMAGGGVASVVLVQGMVEAARGALEDAAVQIAPLALQAPFFASLAMVLTAAGAILALVGVVWRIVASRREQRMSDALDLVGAGHAGRVFATLTRPGGVQGGILQ